MTILHAIGYIVFAFSLGLIAAWLELFGGSLSLRSFEALVLLALALILLRLVSEEARRHQ